MPLSPVVVERRPVVLGERGRLDWDVKVPQPAELPPEWVLRQLADADLDDPSAIVSLLAEYGQITRPYFDPHLVPQVRRRLLGAYRRDATVGPRSVTGVSVEDVRWWLKTARALAGVWSKASLGESPIGAWLAEGFAKLDTESLCWSHFEIALNVGLEPFHARVLVGKSRDLQRPHVDLYSAAAHQVFNLVVTGDTARRCENETCGRTFVRQLGGAKHGQHRSTGLRFCTPECARAETQRQYRRRKSARTKEQKS